MTAALDHILLLGAGIFLISMAIAPFESLGWWAGWLGPVETAPPPRAAGGHAASGQSREQGGPAGHVVFLSGIGSISGDHLLPSEEALLRRLRGALPELTIIHDVFPYAPSGRSLITGQRVFRWLWRMAQRWRGGEARLLPPILNLRNLFQVLVAADNRFGPIYGYGLSRVILERLLAHGYAPGIDGPVVLLGSSGGAQIAIGAAPYLRAATGAPVSVVAFGGVMASDRGVTEAGRLISLYGSGDHVYRLARIGFPGRWPVFAGSHWNRAVRAERLTEREVGPMRHSGRGGYLDARSEWNGVSHLEATSREICAAIRSVIAETTPAASAPA